MMINVMSVMMMVTINFLMIVMMKIIFLIGTKAIKNVRHSKQRLKKISYPLLGTHQDIGIVVFPRMKNKG